MARSFEYHFVACLLLYWFSAAIDKSWDLNLVLACSPYDLVFLEQSVFWSSIEKFAGMRFEKLTLAHWVLALMIVFIWGTNFVVIKFALVQMPPFLLAFLRFALAFLPAAFFIPFPRVSLRNLATYGLCIGLGQFGLLFFALHRFVSLGWPHWWFNLKFFLPLALLSFWRVKSFLACSGLHWSWLYVGCRLWRSTMTKRQRFWVCSWSCWQPCLGPWVTWRPRDQRVQIFFIMWCGLAYFHVFLCCSCPCILRAMNSLCSLWWLPIRAFGWLWLGKPGPIPCLVMPAGLGYCQNIPQLSFPHCLCWFLYLVWPPQKFFSMRTYPFGSWWLQDWFCSVCSWMDLRRIKSQFNPYRIWSDKSTLEAHLLDARLELFKMFFLFFFDHQSIS